MSKSKYIGEAMGSARIRTDVGVKLTSVLKIAVDEDSKEELERLAASEGMNLSQYVRELLMIHIHGRKHLIRLTKARLERMVGSGSDDGE